MATGTIAPVGKHQFFGVDGTTPAAGGKLYTYAAGTTTPQSTYTTSAMTVANANPIILDSAGRCTIYMSPGSAYKLTLNTSADALIWTQDNVLAVPTSTASLDVTGTAGEALSERDCVYCSDGSGGKVAGRFYKADADFTYASSAAAIIGFAAADIASAATGSIRLGGQVTGFTGLSAGSAYYVSATAGAITSSAPTNARQVGVADSTTSLSMSAAPGVALPVSVANGGSGVASHTAYGVIVGGTTATGATQTVSPGAAGTVLTSGGASAVPTWGAPIFSLLYANSGTSTAAGATTVDSIAISGLTVKDRIHVLIAHQSVTQATAQPKMYNVTDGATFCNLTDAGSMTAGQSQSVAVYGMNQQSAVTLVTWFASGRTATPATTSFSPTMTTNWTSPWTLGLRHDGVTAGGTYQYNWAVYKIAGQ